MDYQTTMGRPQPLRTGSQFRTGRQGSRGNTAIKCSIVLFIVVGLLQLIEVRAVCSAIEKKPYVPFIYIEDDDEANGDSNVATVYFTDIF